MIIEQRLPGRPHSPRNPFLGHSYQPPRSKSFACHSYVPGISNPFRSHSYKPTGQGLPAETRLLRPGLFVGTLVKEGVVSRACSPRSPGSLTGRFCCATGSAPSHIFNHLTFSGAEQCCGTGAYRRAHNPFASIACGNEPTNFATCCGTAILAHPKRNRGAARLPSGALARGGLPTAAHISKPSRRPGVLAICHKPPRLCVGTRKATSHIFNHLTSSGAARCVGIGGHRRSRNSFRLRVLRLALRAVHCPQGVITKPFAACKFHTLQENTLEAKSAETSSHQQLTHSFNTKRGRGYPCLNCLARSPLTTRHSCMPRLPAAERRSRGALTTYLFYNLHLRISGHLSPFKSAVTKMGILIFHGIFTYEKGGRGAE